MNDLQVSTIAYEGPPEYDFDRIIYGLDRQIEMLSGKADSIDYLVSIASGLLCGALDVLWVGEFDLARGRESANEKVDSFVTGVARRFGYKGDDVNGAVKDV